MNLKQVGSILYFVFAILLFLTVGVTLLITSPKWLRILFNNLPLILLATILFIYTPLKIPIKLVGNKIYYAVVYQNKLFWASLYDIMLIMYPNGVWKNVNYGFASMTENGHLMKLDKEDEEERFSLQLYHWTVTAMGTLRSLDGMVVVEPSSGRGGGLHYVLKYLNAARVIGVDISTAQIQWCKEYFAKEPNMDFIYGDAENLSKLPQLQPNSIDIVLSIDSAHLYPNFRKFCEEIDRILKPGGYFLVTDFREAKYFEQAEKDMEAFSMKIVKKNNNTPNVVYGLKLDGERRMKLINDHVHFWFKPFLKWNSGAEGSRIFKGLSSGKFASMTYVVQKPKK